MLIDKMFYVYDEDKLHLRKPKLVLNFEQQWFCLDVQDKNTLDLQYGGE